MKNMSFDKKAILKENHLCIQHHAFLMQKKNIL
jgi:hypothetical protein